jgi:GAF domain-containing protein
MKLWADHAPMNYLHKWQLVEAERCRVSGQVLEAMENYDLAIASAKANQYIQEEALANELAAKFYLAQNRITIAKAYMLEARYWYTQWGATAKVQQLQNRYSAILDITLIDRTKSISPRRSSSNRSTSSNLDVIDLESVLRASQAIASEIQLDRLLSTLMTILIENAGAEAGYLLLPNSVNPQVQWRIEAIKTINYKNVIMQSISIDEISTDNNFYVPISLVNYVIRTRENVILNDAAQLGDFQNDPWIIKYQSKSLLCMPLLNQGILTAIVLLENNLTPNAFTPERVEILNLLSSQAAISIVKARLLKEQENLNQSLQAEISDRQLAEKERDRLIAIIQASTDIIGMTSPQGKVI